MTAAASSRSRRPRSGRGRGAPADKSISHRAAMLGAMGGSRSGSRATCVPPTRSRRSPRCARSARGRGRARRESSCPRRRPARRARAGGADRRRQRGHAAAAAAGLARRAGRGARSRSTATSRSAAVRSTASPRRCAQMGAAIEARDGRLPPLTVHGARAARDRLHAAGRQRPGQVGVLLAGLAADGRRRSSSPRRAATTPSGCCSRWACRSTRDGRRITLDAAATGSPPDLFGPRRPELGSVLDRRGAARPGLAAACSTTSPRTGRGPASSRSRGGWAAIEGPLEAAGRAERRRAGGVLTSRTAPLVATEVEAEEVPLAIDELPLVALLGCFAEGDTVGPGRRRAAGQGDRPDRDRRRGAARARRRYRGDRRRLRRARRRRAARRRARRRTAITAWRCSVRSPASPRARASR